MQRRLKQMIRHLLLLSALVLLLCALVISSARFVLPLLNNYRPQISDWVDQQYALELSIANISASWQRQGPALVLHRVSLQAKNPKPQQQPLQVERVVVSLDWWQSLWQRQLQFHHLVLQGAQLSLNGENPRPDQAQLLDQTAEFLFKRVRSFSLQDIAIQVSSNLGFERELVLEELDWLNSAEQHLASGHLRFVDGGARQNRASIALRAQPITDSHAWRQLNAEVYFSAQQLDISRFLTALSGDQLPLHGLLTGQSWLTLKQGKVSEVIADIGPLNVRWQQHQQLQRLALQKARFQFSASDDDWSAQLLDMWWQSNQQSLGPLQLACAKQHGREQCYSPKLPLALLNPLLARWSKGQGEVLSGELAALHVTRDGEQLAYSGRLQQVAVQHPWLNLDKLQMAFLGDEQTLHARLTGEQTYASIPEQVEPRLIRQLQAQMQIDWPNQQLLIDRLTLSNRDVSARAQGRYAWRSGELALYAEADALRGSQTRHYLPQKVMGKAYDYLAQAIVDGRSTGAQLVWHGRFKDYPFADGKGLFQVQIPVEDGQFAFHPDWPTVTDIRGTVWFDNRRFSFLADSGNLAGARVRAVSGDIPDMLITKRVDLQGEFQGEAELANNIFANSLLAPVLLPPLAFLAPKGQVAGQLELHIPYSGQDIRALGRLDFLENQLQLGSSEVAVSGLTGRLLFDNQHLRSEGLSARLWQQPFNLNLRSDDGERLLLEFAGKNWRWSAFPELTMLQGNVDWQAQLALQWLPSLSYQGQLTLNNQDSQLLLPAPLNKAAGVNWPTQLSLSGDTEQLSVEASIAQQLQAQWLWQAPSWQLKRTRIQLGQGAEFADGSAHQLTIKWPYSDVAAWYDWYQQQQGVAGSLLFDSVRVDITQADLWLQPLHQLRLNYRKLGDNQQLSLSANELQAQLQKTPQLLNIDISKAQLPLLDWTDDEQAQQDTTGEINTKPLPSAQMPDFSDWYDVQVRMGPAQIGRYQVDELSLLSKIDGDLLNYDLSLRWPHSSVQVGGLWQQGRSSADVAIRSDDVQLLAAALDRQLGLAQTAASLTAAIDWQGAPWLFNTQSLNGEVQFNTEAGVLTDVNDKGSRVLGVLSLNSIRRRLNFDFRDVFAKGFYFDHMQGSGVLRNGVLHNQDFLLQGAAGDLYGEGELNFNNQQINYTTSFYPNVASSLPVLAAFAITPLTGAVVLAVSTIFKPVIDTITELRYQMTGDMLAPEIIEIQRTQSKVELQQYPEEVINETLRNPTGQ